MLVAVKAPVDCVPLAALAPDQAPEAVQDVAFAEDQVSVELAPVVTDAGLALTITVGAGATAVTSTVAESDAVPPAPVQVRV